MKELNNWKMYFNLRHESLHTNVLVLFLPMLFAFFIAMVLLKGHEQLQIDNSSSNTFQFSVFVKMTYFDRKHLTKPCAQHYIITAKLKKVLLLITFWPKYCTPNYRQYHTCGMIGGKARSDLRTRLKRLVNHYGTDI